MNKVNYLFRQTITAFGASIVVLIFIFYGFASMEPAKVAAEVDSDSIGVTQAVTSGITISAPADITMTALTLTQNTAVGSTTWTVITNNQAGYALTVKASAAPALVDSTPNPDESFTDYSEASAGTQETWSVTNAYEFGWSAFGSDVTGYGTDTDCAATYDVPSTGLLWEGFDGVTPIQMATSGSETDQDGMDTTLCVATEQETVFAPSGTYSATITATATTL